MPQCIVCNYDHIMNVYRIISHGKRNLNLNCVIPQYVQLNLTKKRYIENESMRRYSGGVCVCAVLLYETDDVSLRDICDVNGLKYIFVCVIYCQPISDLLDVYLLLFSIDFGFSFSAISSFYFFSTFFSRSIHRNSKYAWCGFFQRCSSNLLQRETPLFSSSTVCKFILFTLYLCFLFIFFQYLCYFYFGIKFLCSGECPYQYHQSHLYISQPILSVLKAVQMKSALIFGGINFEIESRSFENQRSSQQSPSHSLNTDFTGNNTKDFSNELQHSIRFASLSLAAQNIFHDLIVRRIASFMRLIKITTTIWDN